MTMNEKETAERLGAFDACALSDALDKLKLKGCVTGLVAASPGKRIAGRIQTVKLAAGTPPAGSPVRHLGAAAIDAASAGDVIVIEQRSGVEAGSWGGVLSRAAIEKGVAGVVSDGLVRDVDEARSLDFPIFCRGYTALTARARVYEQETNGPVTIGDVVVEPGYFVVADSSAAVFISPDDIDRVLETVAGIAAREAEMIRRLEAGETASAVLGANYEHMLQGK